jgi:hypothetical protein
MTQSPNPNVILKASENTDLARTATVVRRANTQNGTTAIRNWTMPLPRHGKRRPASQNTKIVILTTDENENDRKPKLAMMTIKKARRNGRSGPSQGQENRKAENNPRTSLPPLRLTLAQNPMNPPSAGGPGVLPPSRSRNQKPRNPPNDHPPLHRSRNTITRAWGPLTYTGRSDQNVRSRGGLRRHARPVRASSSATTEDPSTRRIVYILGSG